MNKCKSAVINVAGAALSLFTFYSTHTHLLLLPLLFTLLTESETTDIEMNVFTY